MAKPAPHLRPLEVLPPELRARLGPEGRRQVADLGATLDRRRRQRLRTGLPGGADCPPFLAPVEAEAPGAARLWVALREEPRFETAAALASVSIAAAEGALGALRRAELVAGADGALVAVGPGSTPA